MTKTNIKEQKFNPLQAVCIIGAGICLIIDRFIEGGIEWSSTHILKAIAGLTLVVYGIFKSEKIVKTPPSSKRL